MNPEYTESKMAAQKLDPEAEMDMLVAEVQRGEEEYYYFILGVKSRCFKMKTALSESA